MIIFDSPRTVKTGKTGNRRVIIRQSKPAGSNLSSLSLNRLYLLPAKSLPLGGSNPSKGIA